MRATLSPWNADIYDTWSDVARHLWRCRMLTRSCMVRIKSNVLRVLALLRPSRKPIWVCDVIDARNGFPILPNPKTPNFLLAILPSTSSHLPFRFPFIVSRPSLQPTPTPTPTHGTIRPQVRSHATLSCLCLFRTSRKGRASCRLPYNGTRQVSEVCVRLGAASYKCRHVAR